MRVGIDRENIDKINKNGTKKHENELESIPEESRK